VLIERVCEDLCAFPLVVEERAPDPFHLLVVQTFLLVLVIETREEPGIETHVSKDSGSSI
jgi:hypothetical protein